MHALNLYGRLAGETNFTFLATVTKNPYFDVRLLTKEGITEMREFYGIAVENNVEVGNRSAIVAIAFRDKALRLGCASPGWNADFHDFYDCYDFFCRV